MLPWNKGITVHFQTLLSADKDQMAENHDEIHNIFSIVFSRGICIKTNTPVQSSIERPPTV